MQADSYPEERRQHRRFEVKNLAIAVPNKPTSRVGRIVNISRGGMAVRYLDQDNWGTAADEVDILINSHFFMTGIPIQNVGDFRVQAVVPFSVMNERQCCLQFVSLSSEQEKQLDEFIATHGVGSSPAAGL